MSKDPWFPTYAQDFISGSVRLMELDEVGAFWLLLCHEWITGSIPASRKAQARICGTDDATMNRIWKSIGRKFEPGTEPHTLTNERMEAERAHMLRLVERGKKGAAKRWEGHHKKNA